MNEPATAEAHLAPAPAESGAGERIYFPELDGLRFVAFMMVYLFHGGVREGIAGTTGRLEGRRGLPR